MLNVSNNFSHAKVYKCDKSHRQGVKEHLSSVKLAMFGEHEIALMGPFALLRMIHLAPGQSPEAGEPYESTFVLSQEHCRLLGEHLLQVADLLGRDQGRDS